MGCPLVPAQTRILPPSGSFLGRWSQAILLGQVGDAVLKPALLLLADVFKQADSEVRSGEEVGGPSQASRPQLWFPNQFSPEHPACGDKVPTAPFPDANTAAFGSCSLPTAPIYVGIPGLLFTDLPDHVAPPCGPPC